MGGLLSDLVKSTANPDAGIISDGHIAGDVVGYIDTGVYILNAQASGSIYKGIPSNQITAVAGPPAAGKTYICLSLVKAFLDSNKKAIVVYFDSENALKSEMFISRGIDPKRVAVVCVSTVEQFKNQALNILVKYEGTVEEERVPLMLVLDSVGMLSTNKELEDSTANKDTVDMTRTKIVKAAMRVLTTKLGKLRVPLLITSHTYMQQGAMYPQAVMGSGEGPKYAASTVWLLSKRMEKEESGVVGSVIHFKLDKSRSTKEKTVVDVLLRFDKGMNKYYGLLDLAEKYNIVKKSSTRWEFPDGTKAFEKAIYKEPEKYFTKDLLDKIDAICQKEFCYGSIEEDTDKISDEKSS